MKLIGLLLISLLGRAQTPELGAALTSARFREYIESRVAAEAKAGADLFVADSSQVTTDGRTWLKIRLERRPRAVCAEDLTDPVFVENLIVGISAELRPDVFYVEPRGNETGFWGLPRR